MNAADHTTPTHEYELARLMDGYLATQVLYVDVAIGVPEVLGKRPRDAGAVARRRPARVRTPRDLDGRPPTRAVRARQGVSRRRRARLHATPAAEPRTRQVERRA